MNRFDRITAILIQLQSRKIVKAQDLADRFGTSLRTIYRDIRTLEEAGVPLYGEAGVGYSVVDGYRLPPVMFTPEEAMAFLTAEKLMGKFTDTALQSHFTAAMYKIKAVLRGDEKDLVENLEEQIIVKEKPRSKPGGNTLDILLKGIAEKKAVHITYRAFGNEADSIRLIEPVGIFHENDNWYTMAWCHLRESYRQFRMDRVAVAKLTQHNQKEHAPLKEFQEAKENFKATFTLQKAVIRVDKRIALYLQERRHYYGFVSEVVIGDYVEMTFLSQSLDEGLARWILMFADHAEIIEPQALKDRLSYLIEKISEKNAFSKNLLT